VRSPSKYRKPRAAQGGSQCSDEKESFVMSTQEALVLEDLSFDDAVDTMTAMTMPDLRHYLEEDNEEDEEIGLRSLIEHPEALSRSFRRWLKQTDPADCEI
jgi:hypothetical protein